MWRIIDLLAYLLFGAKNFKFTPLPDNCPPDGSMLFMSCPPPAYESLPSGFLYYEFGPSCDESDPVAIALSKEIIEALCQSQKVLITIKAYREVDGKERESDSSFICQYSDILTNRSSNDLVYQESGEKFAYLTTGYDKELLSAYYAFSKEMCAFSFYLFPRSEPLANARQAVEKARDYRYALKLDFVDHGPTALEVCINPEFVSVRDVHGVVEQICKKRGLAVADLPMDT